MAGPHFFTVVFSARGALSLASGICVTMLPILFVGWLALVIGRINFVVVSGLIAGSMTDSSALAFATNICDAETPIVAYAAVYPLTTLTRHLSGPDYGSRALRLTETLKGPNAPVLYWRESVGA